VFLTALTSGGIKSPACALCASAPPCSLPMTRLLLMRSLTIEPSPWPLGRRVRGVALVWFGSNKMLYFLQQRTNRRAQFAANPRATCRISPSLGSVSAALSATRPRWFVSVWRKKRFHFPEVPFKSQG